MDEVAMLNKAAYIVNTLATEKKEVEAFAEMIRTIYLAISEQSVCADCGYQFETQEEVTSCPRCKSSAIQELFYLKDRENHIDTFLLEHQYTKDAHELLKRLLIDKDQDWISVRNIHIFDIDWERFKKVNHRQAVYALLFVLTQYNRNMALQEDLRSLEKRLERFKEHLQGQEDVLLKLKELHERSRSYYARSRKVLRRMPLPAPPVLPSRILTFVTHLEAMIAVLQRLEAFLAEVKNDAILNRVMALFSRTITVSIDMKTQSGTNAHITVRIIHSGMKFETNDLAQFLCNFLIGLEKFENVDDYYFKLAVFVKKQVEEMITHDESLFYSIYGPIIRFTLDLHVVDKVGSDFAAQSVAVMSTQVHMPRHDDLQMKVDLSHLMQWVREDDAEFTKTLIHELNHNFDKNPRTLNQGTYKLRVEGIAEFSELVYRHTLSVANISKINEKKTFSPPIDNIGRLLSNKQIPYILGYAICLVRFMARLKQKYGMELHLEIFDDKKRIQELFLRREVQECAELLLRELRQLPDEQFFKKYLEDCSTVGLQPWISEKILLA